MFWWKHPSNLIPNQVPLHQRRAQSVSHNIPSKEKRFQGGTDAKNAVLSWIVCMSLQHTTRQTTIFCTAPRARDPSITLCHWQGTNMNTKIRTYNALSVIVPSRSRVRIKHTCTHTVPSPVSFVSTQNVVKDFSMRVISPDI